MTDPLPIVRTPQALTEAMEAWKRAGHRVAFVPTRDTPQCPIGYRCIEPSRDDWFD